MNWGNIFTTILTAAAAVFIPWFAGRAMPVARWSKEIARDSAVWEKLPASDAKRDYEKQIAAQVARLAGYRKKDSGLNFWYRRGLLVFCGIWYVAMFFVVTYAVSLSKDAWGTVISIPVFLWVAGAVALAAIVWICYGDREAKLTL
ncbi:hypothetical protein [Curtobacterium flaccumfaciens]|uniref:hypothetical protein n=1 Tax=Curtobacterium flaccumfaciens TaxID=2035 RepID=UPI001BDFE55C|nr:hypothetical protein [Curtobacterium flaccumfaciens]MBT1582576.1 hypothetical protein [Curtobacterium flaccumfaciens pv. flaccumfaciens]MCX2796818.1 hypothetical protein [Curtobacterium flaccumfaciens pv. flaccumfaciens]